MHENDFAKLEARLADLAAAPGSPDSHELTDITAAVIAVYDRASGILERIAAARAAAMRPEPAKSEHSAADTLENIRSRLTEVEALAAAAVAALDGLASDGFPVGTEGEDTLQALQRGRLVFNVLEARQRLTELLLDVGRAVRDAAPTKTA